MKILPALLLLSTLSFAQNRFEGTWEMNMDTIELSGPPEEYLLKNGTYHCLTCVPRLDVLMDGNEKKITGHPGFDTISIRILDANSVDFAFKKEGKPTFACTETVSKDGDSMIEEFTENPALQRVTGHAYFRRVARAPADAHALSGSWQMQTVKNVSSAGPMTTYHVKNGEMNVTSGNQNYEAKIDGQNYPVKGEPGHAVSLKSLDPATIEQTDKQDGKVIRISRMTISQDGKRMTVEVTDLQRGSRMTYRAEKRP